MKFRTRALITITLALSIVFTQSVYINAANESAIDLRLESDCAMLSIDSVSSDFSTTVSRIKALESLASAYTASNNSIYSSEVLTCIYIRDYRYNTSSWRYLAGSKDDSFEQYVLSNNPDLINLKYQNELKLPTGETTDFVHMIAAINMMYQGEGNLGSWAGDTAQLVINIKNETGDIDTLTQSASRIIASDNKGNFNKADMIADLDASNIYNRAIESNESISDIMSTYYNNLSNEARVNEFVDNIIKPSTYSKQSFRNSVSSNFYTTSYINSLLSSYGVSDQAHKIHVRACVNAFADYLFSVYNEKVSSIEIDKTVTTINKASSMIYNLSYNIIPSSAINSNNIKVVSSDPGILTVEVSNNKVLDVQGIGNASIEVSSIDNEDISDTINIQVIKDADTISKDKVPVKQQTKAVVEIKDTENGENITQNSSTGTTESEKVGNIVTYVTESNNLVPVINNKETPSKNNIEYNDSTSENNLAITDGIDKGSYKMSSNVINVNTAKPHIKSSKEIDLALWKLWTVRIIVIAIIIAALDFTVKCIRIMKGREDK